ncbi:MAG: ribonuclease HII [Oscillospiraceae bacterium]|nr:ribonuclease HII [Oscillospiraceae bacterium]MDD3833139.1 ribonuclease HII [Oscillospiraceae bacterium]MDD4545859.1 ribonuclease HII [Oscillospiraceae bacterium]
MTNYDYDRAVYEKGYQAVCGVDEAGRGPLAGPVFAAAVVLDPSNEISGLNDSKKLSEAKRESMFDIIRGQSVAYSIASASVEEIEQLNILQATLLAMKRAVNGLSVKSDLILIDGNCMPSDLPSKAVTIVKGDSLSACIGAASILAKVSRDRFMREMDMKYPVYQFAKHKGYGTALHIQLLHEHGCSPIHRRSFLTKILG